MGLFRKKKEAKERNVAIKKMEYHPKIILAFAKGIEGNEDLLKYLNDNNYKELIHFARAIYGKRKDSEWLMENGYPQALALINAYNGDKDAMAWLKKNQFFIFHNMASAIRENNEALQWIKKNNLPEYAFLVEVIKHVKKEIEDENYFRVNKKRIGINEE